MAITLASLLCACAGPTAGSRLVNIKLPRPDIDARIYKVVNGRELQVHIFYPPGYSAAGGQHYPVAVSIHGGGWRNGPVEWGHGDARFMTTLGFVGMALEYRLANQGSVTALDCMKDANSAVRWIRLYAQELNIDPRRVLTIGHSAGGHLSLSTAMFPDIREEGEDKKISSVPDAVVALAPAVKVAWDGYLRSPFSENIKAGDCSPMNNVRQLNIPILIIHGSDDEILPVRQPEEFVCKMKAAGNTIELKIFPGGRHNLFYENKEGIRFWKEAVRDFVKNF